MEMFLDVVFGVLVLNAVCGLYYLVDYLRKIWLIPIESIKGINPHVDYNLSDIHKVVFRQVVVVR